MTFARALVRDLVDKRLWPLALLLVAALIAVPLLLGGGGSADEGAALPAAAVDAAKSAGGSRSAPTVELVGPASVRSRPGKVRDPFRRPAPRVVNAGGGAAPASESSDTGTSPGAKSSDSGATSTGTADPTTTDSIPGIPATPTEKPFAYRTEVRFGRTDANAGKSHGISRLTPLGGVRDPALLYLGVSGDGEHATFLVGPTAKVTGEGECARRNCRIISLRAGRSTIVDVTPSGGAARQYSLDVVSVKRANMPSENAARRARARVHPAGRDILRDVIRDGSAAPEIGKLVYAERLGVLVAKSSP